MGESTQPIFSVPGIRLGSVGAGIKHTDRDDLVVLELAAHSTCAAVFTRNAFCAAPVVVAKRHLAKTNPRYLLINSGNANAGTGDQGMRDAATCCRQLAHLAGCQPDEVLPFSTGVIGENLPLAAISAALPRVLENLRSEGWDRAAKAIMTTDTKPKLVSRQIELAGEPVTICGMAKGSGMIRPDMATMLAYIATDLKVNQPLLQEMLSHAVASSFNAITVDGDTSTNDACVLVASGQSPAPRLASRTDPGAAEFTRAVVEVCEFLARAIVQDGEGASKFVEVKVEQAASVDEARMVAYAVAHSPLVKTALFASDPNWGRILAAVGRAGIAGLEIKAVEVWLDDVCIVRDGGRAESYFEEAGQAVFNQPEFSIRIVLGRGERSTRVWTCDFSYDYVRINAEYRT